MSHGQDFPFHDPTSLGNLAVKLGYATKSQIMKALSDQEEQKPLLGKVLIDQKVITGEQLDELLHLQKVSREKNSTAVTRLEMGRLRRKAREAVASLEDVTSVLEGFKTAG